MNSVTQPVMQQSRRYGNHETAEDWLEALSSGACDRTNFFSGVAGLLRGAPDAGWDILALVDQYYRRGKITAGTYLVLKTHLQGLLVGTGSGDAMKVPPAFPTAASSASSKSSASSAALGGRSASASLPPRAPLSLARSAPAAVEREREPKVRSATPRDPILTTAPVEHALRSTAPAADIPQRSLAAGELLRGRYLVQGILGQGGMGTVYEAIDQYRLDQSDGERMVAIKVLHTEVINRPRLFAELRREFQHLQSLSHPNIVRVHEFDRDGELAFFTMERLNGALLSGVLSAQKSSILQRPYALAIVRDVGAALTHAHSRGVVHGDLNPGNIFITDRGDVRVLDFGASHQLRRGPWISEFDNLQQIAVATPAYASCQLLEGVVADARDDVYALACIAYVLLTGEHPFHDNTALQARTLRQTPRRPHGLRRRQWIALRAGLQFDRKRRPADMKAWLDRLDLRAAAARLPDLSSLRPAPSRRRGSMPWVAAGAVAALIAACAWWASANIDPLTLAGAHAGERFNSMIAAVVDQLTDNRPGIGRKTEPVIEAPVTATPPAPSSAPATAPVAAVRHVDAAAQPPLAHSAAPRVAGMTAATDVAAAAPATQVPSIPTGQSGTAGRARIELAADTVLVPPTESMARILVRRSRTTRGDVSFSWWTESGTAKPGRDFVPVKFQVEHIANGQNAISLVIPVVMDPARPVSRNFYVVIDQPSDNATLGPRTLTMVTLPGPDQASGQD